MLLLVLYYCVIDRSSAVTMQTLNLLRVQTAEERCADLWGLQFYTDYDVRKRPATIRKLYNQNYGLIVISILYKTER